jgi:ADP-ribose pyrophosphatase YjhB (NUDIX family)
MAKAPTKPPKQRPTKEVSVMAWMEDLNQNVLLVRQAAGLKLWTLPGGKVKRGESLVKALKREVYEETGLRVQIGSLLGVLDRHDKDAITLLFAADFSDLFTKKGFTVRQIFLVCQERSCQKSTEDSGLNASIPNAPVIDVVFARQVSLLYRCQGGSWDLVCSSSKRGRSSGEVFLNGDLKPG